MPPGPGLSHHAVSEMIAARLHLVMGTILCKKVQHFAESDSEMAESGLVT